MLLVLNDTIHHRKSCLLLIWKVYPEVLVELHNM